VPDHRELLAVALGGIVGAVVRTALAGWFPHHADAWPWATFGVNLVGAVVLGAVITLIHERHAFRRRLLATGFCGALTTFSTMQLEVLRMLDADAGGLAAAYAGVSIALGLACVVAGAGMARRWQAP
jgi:CrcB protein